MAEKTKEQLDAEVKAAADEKAAAELKAGVPFNKLDPKRKYIGRIVLPDVNATVSVEQTLTHAQTMRAETIVTINGKKYRQVELPAGMKFIDNGPVPEPAKEKK